MKKFATRESIQLIIKRVVTKRKEPKTSTSRNSLFISFKQQTQDLSLAYRILAIHIINIMYQMLKKTQFDYFQGSKLHYCITTTLGPNNIIVKNYYLLPQFEPNHYFVFLEVYPRIKTSIFNRPLNC